MIEKDLGQSRQTPADLISGLIAQEIVLSSLAALLVREGAVKFVTLDSFAKFIADQQNLSSVLPDLKKDIDRILMNAKTADPEESGQETAP